MFTFLMVRQFVQLATRRRLSLLNEVILPSNADLSFGRGIFDVGDIGGGGGGGCGTANFVSFGVLGLASVKPLKSNKTVVN